MFRQIFFTRHNLVPRNYALLSAVPDPITRDRVFRSGEQYKSKLQARAGVRAGTLPEAASFLAEEFAGLFVDEMKPGTGEADDGRIGIGTGLDGRGLREPMLNVRAQPRAFEKDMSAHGRK